MSFKIVCDVKGCGAAFVPTEPDPKAGEYGPSLGQTFVHDVRLPHGWSRVVRGREVSVQLPPQWQAELNAELIGFQADMLPEEQGNRLLDLRDKMLAAEKKERKLPTMRVQETFYVCDCHNLPLPPLDK